MLSGRIFIIIIIIIIVIIIIVIYLNILLQTKLSLCFLEKKTGH